MLKKKKILFYIDTLAQGGLDKVVTEILNNLNFDKYEVTLIRRFPGGYYTNFLDSHIITKSNMPFKEESSEIYNHLVRVLCDKIPRKILYKLFIRGKYDVEVACDDAIAARVIGGSTNKKSLKILWEHMDAMVNVSSATDYSEKKAKWFFDPFNKIIGVSNYCAKRFVQKYGFNQKVSYIYNPVDVENIKKRSNDFVPTELKKEIFNIVMLGALVETKGYLRIINVAKKIKKAGYGFQIFIIGEGNMREEIEEKIEKCGLKNEIVLLGFKENPYPYIKLCDLFVCGSYHESYCLAVAESMVLNKAILSTKCAGPIELLDNGKYGKIVENTEDAIFDGIINMIKYPEERKEYEKLLNDMNEIFSVDESVKKWEKIFDGENKRG